ncbi:PAS domain S-box-containing protein [Solirubrobacter pauli]|uniref:histidine kinase n=1 Tax=Solirubrobacter pauli TaxID=166793 RepID=A0A660LCL8_9ACTN|nr:PAS domain S-box protein [Solirubrobacter pauli]RKQ92808.1 PAS domain S-box-containing protein [Solirubrobacter pauli]
MADVERLGTAPRDVLAALLEAVADAVYLVDPDGRVVFANPAALRALGYEEDELLGRVSHPTIHHSHWDGSHFPQAQCPMLRPRLTGETVRVYGDCFWRKDGSKFRVAYSSAPLAMPEGRGAVVVFRDVTSRMEDEVAARREAVERARAAEIHASRARIVEAADAERRRLGRDLHDGAQQRLVRVLLALRLAGRGADDATRALLDAAAGDVDAAIAELRELGAGIHPQILTNRGIAAAVESLTGPLPLLVEASIPEARYPAGVEAAAYFVIAEALTNVLKHAHATAASVTVREADGRLIVEVADDGRGGVDIDGGSGLRGLEDRVAALDGTFEVRDGRGTTVRAELPL